ncbi:MAG: hypothetical protein ABI782_06340 [Anaerolineaceae bacterium]
MVEKEVEDDDPFEFVAVRFPLAEGVDADALMARTFIEEYALIGMPRQKMLQLFQSQFFAGTNAILVSRGEAFVQAIIDDVYGAAVLQEA